MSQIVSQLTLVKQSGTRIFTQETTKLIHEAHENKVKCLVHCIAGVSRSASVCVAYLMKHRYEPDMTEVRL